MGFDIYVDRYEGQRGVSMPVAAFDEVFGPHVIDAAPEHGYWRVRAPDGSEATLNATVELRFFHDLHLRYSGAGVMDLLVEFAKRANGVIYSSYGPTMLVAEEQREQLPAELKADTVVIHDSDDIGRALAEYDDDELQAMPRHGAPSRV